VISVELGQEEGNREKIASLAGFDIYNGSSDVTEMR
jgi:hypothetical protein